jgi:hypothetical protein
MIVISRPKTTKRAIRARRSVLFERTFSMRASMRSRASTVQSSSGAAGGRAGGAGGVVRTAVAGSTIAPGPLA